MALSRTGTHVYLKDVLQLAFLIDRSLLSMSYSRNTQGKSGIVDFRYKDIQNLE